METVACNLCGNTTAAAYYHLTDLLLEREQITTQLVQCTQCGLIYQNPRPTLDEMGQHYPQEYESYAATSANKPSWLMRKAFAVGVDKRCRTITRYQTGGKLLDVGCAAGNFLHGMQRYPQWELYGLEINEYAAQTARDEYGLNVTTGTIESAAFPDNFFDAITLWDVLEHLHDPLASLNEIRRILKPGGMLVMRMPNGESWDARLFGPYWAGLDAPRHLYVFDRATLSALLKKADLPIKHFSCQIGSYPTFVLSVRFWLKARGVSAQQRQRISRVLYHPIARMVSVPFFWLYSLGLRGPLLIVTAQKAAQ
jgi:ubiquinone/menaquinone biosynthesis C-methylase UbiE